MYHVKPRLSTGHRVYHHNCDCGLLHRKQWVIILNHSNYLESLVWTHRFYTVGITFPHRQSLMRFHRNQQNSLTFCHWHHCNFHIYQDCVRKLYSSEFMSRVFPIWIYAYSSKTSVKEKRWCTSQINLHWPTSQWRSQRRGIIIFYGHGFLCWCRVIVVWSVFNTENHFGLSNSIQQTKCFVILLLNN